MKIESIESGYFFVDGGAMFGAVPKNTWNRKYPVDNNNRCVLTMRCLLVCLDNGRIILIDNGPGNKHLRLLSYYDFFEMKDIGNELFKRGILLDQVTDLVLTHLHFDHCGYTTVSNQDTGVFSLTFPNATCWVGKQQWENFCNPSPLDQSSYFAENMFPVKEAGRLRLIDQDTELCQEIDLRLYNGHTPGQIVPYIKTEATTYVFAGDVIPLAASVSPGWISAYDLFPVTSYYEKVRMLEEAVIKNQTIIYCHDAYISCSKIKKIGHYFKAINKQKDLFE